MKKEDLEMIVDIAKRAEKEGLLLTDRLSLIMDLKCVEEEFNLRLTEFLNTDISNFSHDIVGIQRNLNRETKIMGGHFVPRFAGF